MVGDYRSLAKALNGAATVFALQSPLLRGRPWHGDSFEALAESYAARMLAVQPQGPHALLGWSFGGRLAVAVAQVLARRGMPAEFVGIVDTATHWEEGAASAPDTPATPSAETLDGSLLGAALRTDAMHAALMAAHALPRLDGELHVWRAARNLGDPHRRMAWSRHAGSVRERVLDATHAGIVHHPAWLQELRSLFGADDSK